MSRRLIVIRHAKSAWDDPALDDHDRPLTRRGERSADAIGRWLAERGEMPDEVLCSTALRARLTWSRIAAALPGDPPVRHLPELYAAAPATILQAAQASPGPVTAIVGHNPGLASFVGLVARARPRHEGFGRFPTCATCILDFAGDIAWGAGRVAAFVVPRELM